MPYDTPRPIAHLLTPQLISHFWSKVQRDDTPDGCWMWIGNTNHKGYGRFCINRFSYPAHRVAHVITNGELPVTLLACHSCDVPGCVRPSHIFPGTKKDNSNDASQKGRLPTGDNHHARRNDGHMATGARSGAYTHPERRPRGERNGSITKPERLRRGTAHPGHKLSEQDVYDIRRRISNGDTIIGIARHYSVSPATIGFIKNGKHWAHLL